MKVKFDGVAKSFRHCLFPMCGLVLLNIYCCTSCHLNLCFYPPNHISFSQLTILFRQSLGPEVRSHERARFPCGLGSNGIQSHGYSQTHRFIRNIQVVINAIHDSRSSPSAFSGCERGKSQSTEIQLMRGTGDIFKQRQPYKWPR